MKHLCSCSCNGLMWVTHQGKRFTLYDKTQPYIHIVKRNKLTTPSEVFIATTKRENGLAEKLDSHREALEREKERKGGRGGEEMFC